MACEIGPSYPGFVLDERGACVPTSDTPPGIYVDVACSNFVYVGGDDGPQIDELDKTIWTLAQATKDPTTRSADPSYNVTLFLQKHWPNCTWPPVGGTARLQQLFNVLSIMMGREVVHRGGRVLGTADMDEVDERVASRLLELGMPEFDPSVVPEIPLTPYEDDDDLPEGQPPGPGPDGPNIDEPDEQTGGIDLPPGGQDFPEPAPQDPVTVYPVDLEGALKECQKVPYSPPEYKNIDLDPAFWTATPQTHDFFLFDFKPGGKWRDCKIFNLRFGLCVVSVSGSLYGALDPNNPLPDHPLHLRNEDGAGIDWDQFRSPARWKRQYRTTIGLADGKAVADQPTPINDPGVDPCADDPIRWPTPSVTKFIVTADHGVEPRFRETDWTPRPRVSIVTQGTKVYARLRYFGFPRFLVGGADPQWGGIDTPNNLDGHLVSSASQKTSFEASYKVWALGDLTG